MESFPYRVVTSFRRPGRSAPGPASTRFLAPSTTSLELAPDCSGPSWPAAVPLSGSLNLSAVSWHVRAWRPCFMPPPPVGFSLQSLAPRWNRVRLSASLAPLQFSTVVPEVQCTRSRPPGFTDARADGAVAWFPPGARTPFPPPGSARSRARACNDFPDVLDCMHRSHPVPAASAASKLSSPRESVRTARRFRGRTVADALLGFAPPEP